MDKSSEGSICLDVDFGQRHIVVAHGIFYRAFDIKVVYEMFPKYDAQLTKMIAVFFHILTVCMLFYLFVHLSLV